MTKSEITRVLMYCLYLIAIVAHGLIVSSGNIKSSNWRYYASMACVVAAYLAGYFYGLGY